MTPPPQIKDIAPPIDVFPYPMWMTAGAAIFLVGALAAVAFLFFRWRKKRPTPPPPTPREIALGKLQAAGAQIAAVEPYAFSILVSDILRVFVSDQYQLRATRQTSPEFLNLVAGSPRFSDHEKALLANFLERCDLIKFAHIHATREDSASLVEQASLFVKGTPA
jgi:hypothetical protein